MTDIRSRFFANGDASSVLAGRCEIVDKTVSGGWHDLLAPVCPEGMAVLAVGGYGRRDLFPHSDVDVLLLVEKAPTGKRKEALSAFLRAMWDSGLRFSHSVRTPKECCEVHDQNVELNVSLLDQRFLTGDRNIYAEFAARLPRFLRSQRQTLIRHLCQLTRPRHAKYHNTIYHLEPNIKETPGGLRDLHLLFWLDKLRDDPMIASEWLDGLDPARWFLSSLRCFLHFRSGRDDNALSFDAQEEIAEQKFFPFDDPEKWMREYFYHGRSIHRAALRAMDASEGRNSSLLKEFRQWRSRLSNSDFTVSRERVYFKAPARLSYDLDLIVRLFQFVARHGLKLALSAERRIAEYLPAIEQHFAKQQPHWAGLIEMLELPHASMALQAMHETGVLKAMIPEWKRIECLVVRDFYHRYTVDEHTLIAIQNLEDLSTTKYGELQRFAELLGEVEEPGILRLALLFHDIGKGEGDGAHAGRSVEIAEQVMERIQLPVRKRKLVRFLVENHLELSSAMTSRNLDEPSTARDLARLAGTLEYLKCLTLITYADVSAVNPDAMTAWRREQLWRVYLTTYNELTRELETERIHESRTDSPEKAAFLEGFPVRYLRTHTEEEIDRHLELERRSRERGVAVHVERQNGVFDLAVVAAQDRPFLLASVAGVLASFGMNIVRAEAFANGRGVILDTFAFEDPSKTLELNPSEIGRLSLTIERVALGKQRARQLLKSRRAPAAPSKGSQIAARVSYNNDASESATLFEIVAHDRPGLLYGLARTISEANCNIEVVLIDTEAHKAIDVFYVTYLGDKLTPGQAESIRNQLAEVARIS